MISALCFGGITFLASVVLGVRAVLDRRPEGSELRKCKPRRCVYEWYNTHQVRVYNGNKEEKGALPISRYTTVSGVCVKCNDVITRRMEGMFELPKKQMTVRELEKLK